MTEDEIARFLQEKHLAKLATINPDGTPQITPIWYLYDGQAIVMITGPRAIKVRNIRGDPRVGVCIDRPTPPYAGLVIRGTASIEEVPYQDLAVPMAVRYLGEAEGAPLGAQYARTDLVTIRVRLDRVHSWDFGKPSGAQDA
jgi:PPOX class probable F420-dependent enzyme